MKKYNNIKAILIEYGENSTFCIPLIFSSKVSKFWLNNDITNVSRRKTKDCHISKWILSVPYTHPYNIEDMQKMIDLLNTQKKFCGDLIPCQKVNIILPRE